MSEEEVKTAQAQASATPVAEEVSATQTAGDAGNTSSQSEGRSRRGGRRRSGRRREEQREELINRVVKISRVSKTHKGGRTMSFTALVVVGDGNGTVGVGYGKSHEVPSAISKGEIEARKNMFSVPRVRGTVPEPVIGRDAAGTVLLRPAAPGTGVIAGGPVRAVLECAGISDILTKSMGSGNAHNVVNATIAALKMLEEPQEVALRRNLPVSEVAPARLLREQAQGLAEARQARESVQENKAAASKDGE